MGYAQSFGRVVMYSSRTDTSAQHVLTNYHVAPNAKSYNTQNMPNLYPNSDDMIDLFVRSGIYKMHYRFDLPLYLLQCLIVPCSEIVRFNSHNDIGISSSNTFRF